MSQNMRATPASPGRHGSSTKVLGSGMAIMSDSSIALKPVIDEPSKPIPPSKASASSVTLIEKALSCPSTSVNHMRMKRMPCSSTRASTLICGQRAVGHGCGTLLGAPSRASGGAPQAGPGGLSSRAMARRLALLTFIAALGTLRRVRRVRRVRSGCVRSGRGALAGLWPGVTGLRDRRPCRVRLHAGFAPAPARHRSARVRDRGRSARWPWRRVTPLWSHARAAWTPEAPPSR